MSNLHQEPNWQWPRSPPSPSASTSSSASRSITPTNPWTSRTSLASTASTSGSPRSSPNSSPQPRSPVSTSRCATPVAPTPVRQVYVSLGVVPASPGTPSAIGSGGGKTSRRLYHTPVSSPLIDIPTCPTPAPLRENPAVRLAALFSKSIATPALLSQFKLQTPSLLSRQGWETSTAQRAYGWALQNPRTALLFLICEDVPAWPRAVIYGLEDTMLPYQESDLHGIVADPRRAVETQWRVTTKELPRNGQYVDFSKHETVPLQQVAHIRTATKNSNSLDTVCWRGEHEAGVYVRKRFICSRPSQKSAVLSQIHAFKKLGHANVAKITAWYSHGSTVGLVTPMAQCNLDDYLQAPGKLARSGQLLDWISDLTQALEYIHSQGVAHCSIRPQKILVDSDSRVLFSAFGISSDGPDVSPPRSSTTTVHLASAHALAQQQSLSEHAYVYAAPEVVDRRRVGRPADIFSLGCVFLAMLTVALGQSAAGFAAYRAHASHTASFHANLERVGAWIKQLQTQAAVGGSSNGSSNSNSGGGGPSVGSSLQQLRENSAAAGTASVEAQALGFVAAMLPADPGRRVKMRKLAPYVARWNEARATFRRRSFGGGSATQPNMARWSGESYASVR